MFRAPEHSFRKLSSNHKQTSRTPLREGATDVRWARLKRSTRAACAHFEENDHVTQTCSWTCCRSYSRRHGAGPFRRFRKAVGRRLGLTSSPLRPRLRHRLYRWRLWRRRMLRDTPRAHAVRLSPAHDQRLRILIRNSVLSIRKAPVAQVAAGVCRSCRPL